MISKIMHPKYGKCLLFECYNQIILWENKNMMLDFKKLIKDEYCD